ncbi:MAG: Na+/H+ antiporter subunit E [Alphaproteobacteria bacterium]|nr:Na+/H+ antiporter subunit E [Alphaproteobacteria bacterium]MCY4320281.1 Na+/H+ antiporter subunit E [Alphaproteobacteria bacterium]
MSIFGLNAFLALSWAALIGNFTLTNLLIGYVVGYLALWVARPLFARTVYFERVWRVLRLAMMFIYELVVSSMRVVWDVITPSHLACPGIITIPLDARGEGEILLVANLISLTPGTLSLDLSPDGKTLYVHAMFVDDPDALRRELKEGMERYVLEALE